MSPRVTTDPPRGVAALGGLPPGLSEGGDLGARQETAKRPGEVFGFAVSIGQNACNTATAASHEMNESNDFDTEAPEVTDAADLAAAESDARQHRAVADEARLQAWIARIVRQDQQALADLYEMTAGRVYGLALRITRHVQTAEEVTEDAFWQVWRQAPRFDAVRGSVLAWILTITRSRALDALRRCDRAEPLDEEGLADVQTENDPQDLLAAVQRQHRLHAALRDLDPLPRQLLALAFFRGLSHEEIAQHMSLPLGTVKSHIRRALLRLRQLLGADDPSTTMVTP
jgi:RNA polymerase sigma-70 factor (ECF subfamily)